MAASGFPPIVWLVVLGTSLVVGCGTGPRADWRMVDRTVDVETDQRADRDTPGPDGVVDEYDHAQGLLVRGVNGNISTKFPADGLYEVQLIACEFEQGTRFSWSIDGGTALVSTACSTTVRLAEGRHEVALAVTDAAGGETADHLTVEVRDLIVVGLGDSFSAGSGASRTGLVGLDYDNVRCTRTGHSGQARAALEMERRDPKTSVTFVHLACGGARVDYGLLGPHNGQKPQLLELSEILPRGQVVDLVSFTIGGNDIHFADAIGQLVAERDAPLSLLEGERLHDREQRQLLALRDLMAGVAACLGPTLPGVPCSVFGPSGRDDDARVVGMAPIPLASPDRVLQMGYPDLTTFLVRGPDGTLAPGKAGPMIETCASGVPQPVQDLTDGVLDGRIGGRPLTPPPEPRLSLSEWSWGDATLLDPADPAPNDANPAVYRYRPEGGGATVGLTLRNTLNSVVMESAPRFGWTSSVRWWAASRGHGYCSADVDNWFFRSIFHPNDAGYTGKAEALVEDADALGFPGP